MKTLFALFASLFLVLSIKAQESSNYVITQKDPGTAFLYSTFIPGAGQMHNDQVTLGLGIFALEGALAGIGSIFIATDVYSPAIGITFLSAAGALHLAQMIHAPIVSQKINTQQGYNTSNRKLMGYVYPTANGAGLTLVF